MVRKGRRVRKNGVEKIDERRGELGGGIEQDEQMRKRTTKGGKKMSRAEMRCEKR